MSPTCRRGAAAARVGLVAAAVAVMGVLAGPSKKAGTPRREPPYVPDTVDRGWATYCGVYAVCRAARAARKPCHFEDLLDARYISSRRGSTLQDLTRAARDLGLRPRAVAGLNAAALGQMACPAVLHVKAHGASTLYDHWTLFMGLQGGKAILYDGPHETPRRVPLARLTALWDGTAVLLDASPPAAGPLRLASAAQYFVYACLLLTGVLGVGWVAAAGRKAQQAPGLLTSLRQAAWQAALLLALAMLAAAAAALGAGHGPLADLETTNEVTSFYVEQLLPRYGPRDLARLLAQRGVRFVDPRSESEFNSGHLPGAVHLPVPQVLAGGRLRERLKELPPADRWVVYETQNACRAELLAKELWRAGIENVAIAQVEAAALGRH